MIRFRYAGFSFPENFSRPVRSNTTRLPCFMHSAIHEVSYVSLMHNAVFTSTSLGTTGSSVTALSRLSGILPERYRILPKDTDCLSLASYPIFFQDGGMTGTISYASDPSIFFRNSIYRSLHGATHSIYSVCLESSMHSALFSASRSLNTRPPSSFRSSSLIFNSFTSFQGMPLSNG